MTVFEKRHEQVEVFKIIMGLFDNLFVIACCVGKVWSFSGICDSNSDLQNCKAALWFQRDYKKKSDLDNYTRSLLKKVHSRWR